jgi:hypothetical protein
LHIPGLLELSGNPNNYLGSCAAISITSKILDHQFNPEAKKFLEVFAKTKIELIQKMKLGLHILRIGSQNNPGLVCLFHYLSNNSKEINPSDVVQSYSSY